MVSVRINNEEHKLEEVDQQWLRRQIDERQKEHQPVCVAITIKTDRLDMILRTPTCAGGGGGGRRPNPAEQEVFGVWEKLHLNRNDFTHGNVWAFLQQLRRFI